MDVMRRTAQPRPSPRPPRSSPRCQDGAQVCRARLLACPDFWGDKVQLGLSQSDYLVTALAESSSASSSAIIGMTHHTGDPCCRRVDNSGSLMTHPVTSNPTRFVSVAMPTTLPSSSTSRTSQAACAHPIQHRVHPATSAPRPAAPARTRPPPEGSGRRSGAASAACRRSRADHRQPGARRPAGPPRRSSSRAAPSGTRHPLLGKVVGTTQRSGEGIQLLRETAWSPSHLLFV